MKLTTITLVLTLASTASADTFPFLRDAEATALASELSGESAKRNLEGLSRLHRMRGSRQYQAAADLIVAELKRGGLQDAHVELLPADGKIFYGTQRSRPPWNADFAELWELDASGAGVERLASWDAAPITLAQDSESGDVTTTLVDAGDGTAEADYANKDVKGKLVLASAQPGPSRRSRSRNSARRESSVTRRTRRPHGGATTRRSCAGDTSTRSRRKRPSRS